MLEPTIPTAFFCAPDDPITDAVAAATYAESVGAEVHRYPGMLHEPFNEIGKEQMMADVAAFLGG